MCIQSKLQSLNNTQQSIRMPVGTINQDESPNKNDCIMMLVPYETNAHPNTAKTMTSKIAGDYLISHELA